MKFEKTPTKNTEIVEDNLRSRIKKELADEKVNESVDTEILDLLREFQSLEVERIRGRMEREDVAEEQERIVEELRKFGFKNSKLVKKIIEEFGIKSFEDEDEDENEGDGTEKKEFITQMHNEDKG